MTSKSAMAFVLGLAAIPLTGLLLFLAGFIPLDGVGTPPAWEAALGQAALKASLARKAAGLVDPVGGNPADLSAGMTFYLHNCTGCHGAPSKPSHWGTHDFYPRAPQFADSPPDLTAPEMFVAVKYGIRYTGMYAHLTASDQQIWQTVSFLSRLQSLPAAVDSGWKGGR